MVFRSRTLPFEITLYPMVHVGEERFYKAAYDDALGHDVVLVEGVRSPVSRHITRSYRWIDFDRLGLVLQPKCPPPETVAARIVQADLSTDDFHRQWRKIPLSMRAIFFVLAPLIGLHRRIFATRESLARKMCLEDRRSAEEILNWDPKFDALNHSILHARDAKLIDCIGTELNQSAEPKRIAIIYGARHMRAVVKEMTKRNFYCAESSWRTIFSF